MATQHTGHTQPSIDLEEHRSVGGVNAKAVVPYAMTSSGGLSPATIAADGSSIIGNSALAFRSEFVNGVDSSVWTLVQDTNDVVAQGGNSEAASYLCISKSPLVANTETSLTSIQTFSIPYKFGAGLSLSQRIIGQEFSFELVAVGASGSVTNNTAVANVAISGNITVVTNVWTINTTTAHGLHGNDRIVITGCTDPRLNVGPVNVTAILSTTQFTITSTLANATYTVGASGQIVWADAFAYAMNAASYLYENATATNATFATRRNGSSYRNLNSTVATTTAIQSSTSGFSDAFNAASNNELYTSVDEVSYRSITPDGVATPSGLNKWSQGLPDNSFLYKIRLRAKNLPNFTVPIARITNISKSGSTTATVTTDVAHGLSTSDFVQIYGVLNQTDFPNLTAQTAVASIVDTTNFTIVIGATIPTISSSGGTVIRNQGSVLSPALNFSIQSIQQTSQVLTVTLNTTATTALPGEYYHLYGMTGSAQQYEGAYKVLLITGTTILLQSTGVDFGLIATGGAIIKRTDYRIHFVKAVDYTRLIAEIIGGRGNSTDINNAVPVAAAGGTITTVSTVSTITNGNLAFPGIIADIASAALTVTTTTGAATPTFGTAFQINIAVTAVTGTLPTLDVQVQESRDSGTNWVAIYDFPRITATGSYNSPVFTATGNRVRYVQTVTGTTPSFTRSLNRLQSSGPGAIIRQLIDRSVNINSLNSTTPNLAAEQGTHNIQLTANVGAVATTAPQFQIEASDDAGATWYSIGTPLTAVASTTVSLTVASVTTQLYRARVSTAGSGATAGYVMLRAY